MDHNALHVFTCRSRTPLGPPSASPGWIQSRDHVGLGVVGGPARRDPRGWSSRRGGDVTELAA
jgi:hypothetical protein